MPWFALAGPSDAHGGRAAALLREADALLVIVVTLGHGEVLSDERDKRCMSRAGAGEDMCVHGGVRYVVQLMANNPTIRQLSKTGMDLLQSTARKDCETKTTLQHFDLV